MGNNIAGMAVAAAAHRAFERTRAVHELECRYGPSSVLVVTISDDGQDIRLELSGVPTKNAMGIVYSDDATNRDNNSNNNNKTSISFPVVVAGKGGSKKKQQQQKQPGGFLAALKRLLPDQDRRHPTKILGIKLNMGQNIGALMAKNPGALESLLEEMTLLPTVKSLHISLPYENSSNSNTRRLVRILTDLVEPRQDLYKLVLDENGRGITLNSSRQAVDDEGSLEIGVRIDPPGNNHNNNENITGRAATIGALAALAQTRHRAANLHDPLVQAFLGLPQLRTIIWPGCDLMADTVQQLCNNSNLVQLELIDVSLDQYHTTILMNALTTTTKATTTITATKAGTTKKRKRSLSATSGTKSNINNKGSLSGLERLLMHDIGMEEEAFTALWTMVAANHTLKKLSISEISLRPNYATEDKLWKPIFDSLATNDTLEEFTFHTIFNKCSDGTHWVQLDDEYTVFVMRGLLHTLGCCENRTLVHIDFGFRPARHPEPIQELLHFNIFGLRSCLANSNTSTSTIVSSTSSTMSSMTSKNNNTGMDITRNDFGRAIVAATEKDRDETIVTPKDELLPCLFKIFQENPMLVEYLN